MLGGNSMDSYSETILHYNIELQKEIDFLKSNGARKYKITDGKEVSIAAGEHIYCFESETELFLSDSAQIKLYFKDYPPIFAQLLSIDGFTIYVSTKESIYCSINSGFLSCDPWMLLEGLKLRLTDCLNKKSLRRLSKELVEIGPSLSQPLKNKEINIGQTKAMEMAMTNPITFIWGPPGTGKTYSLAEIAIEQALVGNKVLMVSHSNVSVDGAVKEILDHIKNRNLEVEDEFVTRYGYVRDRELAKHETATSYNYVLSYNPYLKEQLKVVNDAFSSLTQNNFNQSEINQLKSKKASISIEIIDCEHYLLEDANIIATTISKVTVERIFFDELEFDTVIFDEVSMAYIPQIIYAASLANKHLICLGDFRQLAPIAQASNTDLNNDIFSFVHITDSINRLRYHPWMVMINEERRTDERIGSFVNRMIYDNLINFSPLEKNADLSNKLDAITSSEPFSNEPLVLIDLAQTYSVCLSNSDHSRYNFLAASISLAMAIQVIYKSKSDVAIITPYAAQARLINAMMEKIPNSDKNRIRCSTIHQYQGSQSDVVILDLVENYPRSKPGILLSDTTNNHINRLINVAVTRSKGKFILVTNSDFWRDYPKPSIVKDLVHYIKMKGKVLRDNELIEFLKEHHNHNLVRFFGDSFDPIDSRINKLESSFIMTLPKLAMIDGNAIFPKLDELIENPKMLVSVTAQVPEIAYGFEKYINESETANLPLVILDDKQVAYGLPFIKDNIISKRNKYTIPPDRWLTVLIRGKKLAQTIISMNNIEIKRVGYIKREEQKLISHKANRVKTVLGLRRYIEDGYECDSCKGRIALKKSKSWYCKCKSCGSISYLTPDMINDYISDYHISCPVDGGHISARLGQYGVYIRCGFDHYVKIDEIVDDRILNS